MRTKTMLTGLLIAVCVACFLAPFASSSPDGLETVARVAGFAQKDKTRPLPFSLFEGYAFPGIRNEAVSTALSGLFGVLAVFAVIFFVLNAVKKKTE